MSNRRNFIKLSSGPLRWEQHSEFTTFTWIWTNANCSAADQFDKVDGTVRSLIRALRQTGQLLVAIRLEVEQDASPTRRAEQIFDKNSLAMVATKSGAGVAASDFRVDEKGFTKILVCDLGLTSHDLGALVQRLLEIETYRPLALLGLSAALLHHLLIASTAVLLRRSRKCKAVRGCSSTTICLPS
ncbi:MULTISPECIES: DUF3422 family protein [unclassified Bradyrhizobium]|uniref:DUF3422 family protein n=1 Tax=unclassified Bradyrhizobium TaxID=2631580 RepID=UPI00209F7633|nr:MULTISPECIES: DUF3422 family protein [unclassified Bradyrhizobium]